MSDGGFERRVAAVRRFNRFYTQKIGVLREGLLDSPFSLAEARVLYELAQGGEVTASQLARELGLDPGYLSRILRGFLKRRLVERQRSPDDARRQLLSLTAAGEAAFAPLDRASRDEIGALLAALPASDQNRLVTAMRRVAALLGDAPQRDGFVLRSHGAGDIGWIVHRHGALYSQEYGWDMRFEAMVGAVLARFIENFDAARERCWIAEADGVPVGSVALVKAAAQVGKLRVLLVEPAARGRGLGGQLIDECLRFARTAGYRAVALETFSVLVAARRLYEAAGFQRVAAAPQRAFGHDLVAETWELPL
jgi:DNA-binding MarR family transcriptional regulator/GNAT superfamily N-acetyltransferase